MLAGSDLDLRGCVRTVKNEKRIAGDACVLEPPKTRNLRRTEKTSTADLEDTGTDGHN